MKNTKNLQLAVSLQFHELHLNINFLLTEREVCREISDQGVFCMKKERGPIFLCTDRANEVKKVYYVVFGI